MDKQKSKSSSLFDDIFRLQNAAPDEDIDPEDPEDGFLAQLVEGVDAGEDVAISNLRRQAAIIPDDPKYKGKRTSRKDLYSDEEDDQFSAGSRDDENADISDGEGSEDLSEGEKEDDDDSTDDQSGSDEEKSDKNEDIEMDDDEATTKTTPSDKVEVPSSKSDDRDKGKAVTYQLGVWDDLIKSRIALQKMVTAANRLPQPDTWTRFAEDNAFRTEAKNVHSSVRKLMSALLDLQLHLSVVPEKDRKKKKSDDQSDEEITSESEEEDIENGQPKRNGTVHADENEDEEVPSEDDEEDNEEEEKINDSEKQKTEAMETSTSSAAGNRSKRNKRKLSFADLEEMLSKRQKEFQPVRNETLLKWDEKTRLIQGKVRAKNFAAFETSVLKQIQQVLVNKERLVRRIHQQRSAYRILGLPSDQDDEKPEREEDMVDDEEEDVELKLKEKSKSELVTNPEIIDDNDFYHVCLRDLIEMKQNEETDPVTANKQWLEIQRLRNKQKRKVDTRASKGRKIRYSVKEKLKNYMTPYDKSLWADEQKDDLFKALFGGRETTVESQAMGGKPDLPFKLGI